MDSPNVWFSRLSVLVAALLMGTGGAASPATQQQPGKSNQYTPYAVGINGGEPSIGFDPIRNAAMYGSGTSVLRLTWDDTTRPATMKVVDAHPTTAVFTLDAITAVDQNTGRTFNTQLAGGCSLASFSDDAGATWTPSQGCGENTLLDHESIGAGPFHSPLPGPDNLLGREAVYYCAQNGFNSTCAVSLDGGLTFGPGVYTQNTPANDPNDPNTTFAAEGGACTGLHGHVRVGPDGTAYLPLKGCFGQPTTENGTNTEYWGGRPALSISADNGTSWQIHGIPAGNIPNGRGGSNPVSNQDESDPSIGISRQHGVLYFGWENGTNPSDVVNGPTSQAMIAVSHDDGNTWSNPVDVSSPLGINNVQFPEVIAGDDNRAAFAFLGTPAVGDDQSNAFPTDPGWHLYISTTYDGGKTWKTVDTTPATPVQRGCVDMQGTTIPPSSRANICGQRNMLDFNDITVDREGRVLVAYTQGCSAKCARNPHKGADEDVEMVMRQSSGIFLYK